MHEERNLLVVSGPSGIGKDTVVSYMIQNHPGIELAVSATTRPARDYEVDGVHYHFLSVPQFEQWVAEGKLVEYINYAGNYYGTPKCEVKKRIEKGIVCVLVIEVNGAANVKAMYPDCTTVFIIAPSMEEHERRLRSRATEDEAGMRERMRIAEGEMAMADTYDFQLVNDDPKACAERLFKIVESRRTAD